jgi:hypothetical protein
MKSTLYISNDVLLTTKISRVPLLVRLILHRIKFTPVLKKLVEEFNWKDLNLIDRLELTHIDMCALSNV